MTKRVSLLAFVLVLTAALAFAQSSTSASGSTSGTQGQSNSSATPPGSTAQSETQNNTAGSISGNAGIKGSKSQTGSDTNQSGLSIRTGVDPQSAKIATDGVTQAIKSEQTLANQNIFVSVDQDNRIVLSGNVDSQTDKEQAMKVAQNAAGNRLVVNNLAVQSPNAGATSGVSGGVTGSAVGETGTTASSQAGQTGQAGTQTGSTAGQTESKGSTGSVGAPAGSASASTGMGAPATVNESNVLREQLQSAFVSEPTLANSHVAVNVTDTTIDLTGSVPTAKERQTAKRIAQSYAGNRKVNDNLTITGKGAAADRSAAPSGSAPSSAGAASGTGSQGTTTADPSTETPKQTPKGSTESTPPSNPQTQGDQTSNPR